MTDYLYYKVELARKEALAITDVYVRQIASLKAKYVPTVIIHEDETVEYIWPNEIKKYTHTLISMMNSDISKVLKKYGLDTIGSTSAQERR